ncbi:MAG TPA: alpha/beta hydrolase [Candidatus Saccharimonadales bacterium]|jgi:pimeloyl-ACP methyl ester carboxylesterase|nr:alpha/beta hydrolase [Candidatus Saccharimonadales bacterium]
MQVVINKLLINYQSVGNGPVVIIVHGWGDDLLSFVKLQESLSKSYRVISLDLPGFGKSTGPDSGWSLDDFSEFIRDFTDKLKLSVYAYIGHSNGGGILIKGLADKTITADKLVLIASAGVRGTQQFRKTALKVGVKIGKIPLKILPTTYQLELKKRLYKAIKSDAQVNPQMLETFKKIVKQDVTRDASKLSLPSLIIYGRDDKVTPPEYGQIFNELIKGSNLELIAGCGHFVHLQQPEKVEALIEDFLK